MEKELKTSGKMTWGFIWRFIIYYVILSIIFAVIYGLLSGKMNLLVASIYSIVTMAILIFIPSKLATSDIFKDKKMDNNNERKFKRNIIIFYILLMIIVSFGNVINYTMILMNIDYAKTQSEQIINESDEMEDEEKQEAIEQQNAYVEEVKSIQKEIYLIISMIDVILFIFGGFLEFKFINKFQNEL